MKRLLLAALAVLSLGGCAATLPDPVVHTEFVDRPVAVKCVPNPPVVAPVFVNTDTAIKAAPDPRARATAYAVGRLQDKGYIGELEAALKGCTG